MATLSRSFNLHKQLKVERKTIHFLRIINLLLLFSSFLTVNYYYLRSLDSDEATAKTTRKGSDWKDVNGRSFCFGAKLGLKICKFLLAAIKQLCNCWKSQRGYSS
jgi:hypothetical protein